MDGAAGALAAADQLCRACVDLLDVDGASLSSMHEGGTRGTFGSSGEMSRRLDQLQFTFGEGPCLEAVSQGTLVSADDLDDPAEQRWPAFAESLRHEGVSAVFALPVVIAAEPVGALDLFRRRSGPLSDDARTGALLAAQVARRPLLDLMTVNIDWDDAAEGRTLGWEHLAPLERVEVYQATGMIIAALDVTPDEALIRLRAYAFTHAMTASETAWAVVDRRLSLQSDDWQTGDKNGS
jgi:GAF domain